MLEPQLKCPSETNRDKSWSYYEYYIGKTDEEQRRSGAGENHWTGAESIEWYLGEFCRDAMHGPGEYRWRHRGPDGAFTTYEGRFHANRMHGYGTMSYPDGRVFNGLFYKNVRWGPGIETHARLQSDVGLWRGNQLIRLAWRPQAPSVVLDFMSNSNGTATVESHRIILMKTSKIIGETNAALELLKQNGADPQLAAQMWTKLYSAHCTDLKSKACHFEFFERNYYGSKINSLEEVSSASDLIVENNNEVLTESDGLESTMYYAWNNCHTMLHMMKHCYKHEKQRKATRINLTKILNGPRRHYRPAGKLERNCRTLLMASYLGHIINVVQLINVQNVYPDIADMQGNTSLMYATCGDQPNIIHFLVEAGANVNGYNDCCCTPLGVALMRYACAFKDIISPKSMVEALLSRSIASTGRVFITEKRAFEWYMSRDLPADTNLPTQETNPLLLGKANSRQGNPSRRGTMTSTVTKQLLEEPEYDSDDSLSEDKRLYSTIGHEYSIRVNNLFMGPNVVVPYLFTVTDMAYDVENIEADSPKKPVKGYKDEKSENKPLKDNRGKPIPAALPQVNGNSMEKLKVEMLSKMMLTILQLLADGADPKLVVFPQPALLIGVTAGNADLVRHLARYGVDINQKFSGALDYTALDVAISRPLTSDNVELIRALLESGADVNHRLQYPEVPGPTLLHALLGRNTESEDEDKILHQILELLLEYRCNPGVQFNGHSAIDTVMTNKKHFIETLIKCPATNLNEPINDYNQTILVKMLSLPYFKVSGEINRTAILSHLLLYGADPLLECQDGEDKYGNIFEFTKKMLDNINQGVPVNSKHKLDNPAAKSKLNVKGNGKPEGKSKANKTKTDDKLTADEIRDYKLEIVLVTECARILHIRWLQTKLMKKLLDVIFKYKHRPWNMIIKEHENRQTAGLWLSPQRCLEIWGILKTTRKKIYKDERILKQMLCIVEFYNSIPKLSITVSEISPIMTSNQKRNIESKVTYLLKEHKIGSELTDEVAWKDIYVKPELAFKSDRKFNICFECAIPLSPRDDDLVLCTLCNVVSFCSFKCMGKNTERINCHPCSGYIKQQYTSINLMEPSGQEIVSL